MRTKPAQWLELAASRMFLPSLYQVSFMAYPGPHRPSLAKYPFTWSLGDMVSSPPTLRPLSLEQAQVAKCPSLKPKFSPKPTFQGQSHHRRRLLSTSIPGTTGCVLRAGATSRPQGSLSKQPLELPAHRKWLLPPWVVPLGLRYRNLTAWSLLLTQPTWSDSLKGNRSHLGHSLPPLTLSSRGAPCRGCTQTPYSAHLPCSGLTPTPVWDSSPSTWSLSWALFSSGEERSSWRKVAALPMALLVRDRVFFCCLHRSVKPQLCWSPQIEATPRLLGRAHGLRFPP